MNLDGHDDDGMGQAHEHTASVYFFSSDTA